MNAPEGSRATHRVNAFNFYGIANPAILVVENTSSARAEIVDYLSARQYKTLGVIGIEEMRQALQNDHWNILLLELTLPDGNGLAAIKELRATYGLKIGILVVTDRIQVEHRIEGINAGADAYLSKPVNLKEVEATIVQLNRRLGHMKESQTIQWSVDEASLHLLCPTGHRVPLTVTEAQLLKNLLRHPGQPVTRTILCECLPPGSRTDDTRRLDSILSRLRTKTKKEAGLHLPIHTLRNKGYTFAGN